MGTMTLEQGYFIVQIVAGLAVVLSLIYVGIGVRQNAQAVRLSTSQRVLQEIRETTVQFADNAELADILLRGVQAAALEGQEKLRFYALIGNFMRVLENGYFQFQAGALDPRLWRGMQRQWADLLSTAGARANWEVRKHWYSDEFQQYFEKRLLPSANREYKIAGS
jgi:hypothetical protein